MLKKIKKILYLISFPIFIILITKFYFSDKNIKQINKSRSAYSVKVNNDNTQNLPLLKNDTNNIIEFIDDIDVYKKKKKKYTFWDLINK